MKFDVIVIGSGIVGLSSAYHIKRLNQDLNIAVLDRCSTYAQGNTGRATAGFRDIYSSEINYLMSSSSIDFYHHIQEDKKKFMGMSFLGYLFLLSKNELNSPVIERILKRGKSRLLDDKQIGEMSGLQTKPDSHVLEVIDLPEICGGLYGENCGIFEPDLICSFYYEELKKMGVEFSFNTTVEGLNLTPVSPMDYPGEPFLWQEKTISGINTNHGNLSAEKIIIASDVWANQLLDPIGIDTHSRPKKRQVFQVIGRKLEEMLFNCNLNKENIYPMTVLPKYGIHFRPTPNARAFRVSGADEIGRSFSLEENPDAERSFYDYSLKPVLQEYFPAFTEAKIQSMWAGYYSYNTLDSHPSIFSELNLIISTGTSGSGLMKGDAIGRIVEGLFSGREKTELYGGKSLNTSSLGIKNRDVPREDFVI